MVLLEITYLIIDNLPLTPIIPHEAWVALVGLAASMAAQGYSAYKKNQASNKLRDQQASINNKQKGLADYYESEANRDFFTTDIAKGTVNRLGEQLRKANKSTADAAAKGGATQEAKVAAKGENLGRYNDALGRLASHGAQYKSGMYRDYRGMLTDIQKGNASLYGADVDSWGNLANNSGNALSQSLSAIDFEKGAV